MVFYKHFHNWQLPNIYCWPCHRGQRRSGSPGGLGWWGEDHAWILCRRGGGLKWGLKRHDYGDKRQEGRANRGCPDRGVLRQFATREHLVAWGEMIRNAEGPLAWVEGLGACNVSHLGPFLHGLKPWIRSLDLTLQVKKGQWHVESWCCCLKFIF